METLLAPPAEARDARSESPAIHIRPAPARAAPEVHRLRRRPVGRDFVRRRPFGRRRVDRLPRSPPQLRQAVADVLFGHGEILGQPVENLVFAKTLLARRTRRLGQNRRPSCPTPGSLRGRRARGPRPRVNTRRACSKASTASFSKQRSECLRAVLLQEIARVGVVGQREDPQVDLPGRRTVRALRSCASGRPRRRRAPARRGRRNASGSERARRPARCPAPPRRCRSRADGRRSCRCSLPSPAPCRSAASRPWPRPARRAACSW